MTAVRTILMLTGLTALGYGGLLLVTGNPWPVIVRIGVWAAAGVILHDFVFAPACVAIAASGRRLLPTTWQAPVAVAALLTVTLLLIAVPVFDRPGARPDNATVLDRDYHHGLWIAVLGVWILAAVWIVAAARSPRRRVATAARLPDAEGPRSEVGGGIAEVDVAETDG